MSLHRIAELAEAEHRLAAEGPAEELLAVQGELGVALGALPRSLSAADRALLVQVYELRERTIEMLRTGLDEAAEALARLDKGRATVRAYAPAGVAPGPSVDTAA